MSFAQFFQDNLFLFILFFAAVIGIIIYEIKHKGSNGVVINNVLCAQKLNNGALLFDLRSYDDFKRGHIAGARQVSTDQLLASVAKLSKGKDQEIIICDKDGYSCKAQAASLVSAGYRQVYTLQYGMSGWFGDSLPVV